MMVMANFCKRKANLAQILIVWSFKTMRFGVVAATAGIDPMPTSLSLIFNDCNQLS